MSILQLSCWQRHPQAVAGRGQRASGKWSECARRILQAIEIENDPSRIRQSMIRQARVQKARCRIGRLAARRVAHYEHQVLRIRALHKRLESDLLPIKHEFCDTRDETLGCNPDECLDIDLF